MRLIDEKILDCYLAVFDKEKIDENEYRLFVDPHKHIPGSFIVTIIWSGFDAMGTQARHEWIWNRVNQIEDFKEVKKHLGSTFTRGAKELGATA